MNTQAALKMAIEALTDANNEIAGEWSVTGAYDEAINACKEALESQEMYVHHPFCNADRRKQIGCSECICIKAMDKGMVSQEQEPVAWIIAHTDGSAPPPYIVNHEPFYKNDSRTKITPLYTHPAQPLSDDEIELIELYRKWKKEKNHG